MLTLRDCQPLAKRDGMTATLTLATTRRNKINEK